MTKTERAIRLIAVLILIALPLTTVYAQDAGIFSSQCETIDSATVEYYIQSVDVYGNISLTYAAWPRTIRNLDRLAEMAVTPGTWYGYEVAYPFGGTYPDNQAGYWYSKIKTATPCGSFETWAWNNRDGTLIVFAFDSLTSNCDANGEHCGMHQFIHYNTTVEEWRRVTR